MSNEITVFNNEDFGKVRTVKIGEEIYFVAKDVCDILELTNTTVALGKLDDDERTKLNLGRQGETNLVNEYGLYSLILTSRKPNAKKFKRWVTHDILPQIKNHGSYDMVEQGIKTIEDEKERELSLGLYAIEQALESNKNDLTLSILYNQKKAELESYKQTLRLNNIEKDIKEIDSKFDKFVMVGDRVQFKREIDSICRASGMNQGDIFTMTYDKFKDMYGIDLRARANNMRKECQNARKVLGKKPYAESTLKSKINPLDVVSNEDMWMEMSKCLGAVRIESIGL